MNKGKIIFDLIGVGLGPFNLGLAALAQPIKELKTLFFEKESQFNWHPGMLIDGASLQVPFMADLVTLANPSSPFSFLEYLNQHRRIYKFYFLEKFHISRQEYNHYCQWVSEQLKSIKFSHHVKRIEHIHEKKSSLFKISVDTNGKKTDYHAKHIVLGIGTEPNIPNKLNNIKDKYVDHSSNFIHFKQNVLQNSKTVCVIGSGQSAAEIVLELLNNQEQESKRIVWATRSPGFFPMEYSKFGLEHFSPEYMQYFYHLNPETKKQLIRQQGLMYKGISHKTISGIFEKLYQSTIANQPQPLELMAYCELKNIIPLHAVAHHLRLDFKQTQLNKGFQLDCDAVVLATGYRCNQPHFLKPLNHLLVTDDHQTYALNEDFSVQLNESLPNKIFIQNNSLYSHGIGSPDLGLGCYRNSIILNRICKKEIYPTHSQNVFQSFNLSKQTLGLSLC